MGMYWQEDREGLGRYGNRTENGERCWGEGGATPRMRLLVSPRPSRAQLEPAVDRSDAEEKQRFCRKNRRAASFCHADSLGPVAAVANGTASETVTKGELKPLLKITL